MGENSKNCKLPSPSHKILKDRAKNKVEDLQFMVNELQLARKESRAADVATLEEQLNQILQDWKAELDEPATPASSLLEISLGSYSATDLDRLLRQCEEEDDATSSLAATTSIHTTGSTLAGADSEDKVVYEEIHTSELNDIQGFENYMQQQHEFQGFEHYNGVAPSFQGSISNSFEAPGVNLVDGNFEMTTQLEHCHLDVLQNFDNEFFVNPDVMEQWGVDDISDFSKLLSNINHPASAFLGPKCALWDCARPALLSEGCKNYCSTFHVDLAISECLPGIAPIVRPGGIDLKDSPLLAALKAKIEGKYVGIPECEGAATAKSPWNSPDLFDISISEGEKIREWLFFDKPRRAFEKGNKKQRSLPDHEGRGWHESRKQIMKEFGGQKRSYYADPQPQKNFEWHLFEYEINNCDTCALYRLELKAVEDKKKSPKTKGKIDPLVDLQKRMGRLTAKTDTEDKCSGKAKVKRNFNSNNHGNISAASKSSFDQGDPPESELIDDKNKIY